LSTSLSSSPLLSNPPSLSDSFPLFRILTYQHAEDCLSGHIPGYTGHVKQAEFKFGKSNARISREVMAGAGYRNLGYRNDSTYYYGSRRR
jgi:hypothetical protein